MVGTAQTAIKELDNMKEVNCPLTSQLRKKCGNSFFNFFIN